MTPLEQVADHTEITEEHRTLVLTGRTIEDMGGE
jgi:hypothetical protein